MKIMAIDYGDAHTGIAVSDALLILQFAVGKITEFPRKAQQSVHIEVPDTIADNGAYELDATADNSFVIDETGLEHHYLQGHPG